MVGKLVTSVTMTIFYVLVYHIGSSLFAKNNKAAHVVIYTLAVIRVILCLFPQNGWYSNESNLAWGILRNIPFVILGVIVILLFYRNRNKYKRFRNIWLWILLSFAFYIPVVAGAGMIPMLGMLMLPKTICYLIIVVLFYRAVARDEMIV